MRARGLLSPAASICSCFAAALVLGLSGSIAAMAETPSDRAAALEAHIARLRTSGQYAEAAARARELRTLRQEDRATRSFEFYESLSGSRGTRMSKVEALREAKQWLRDYRDESGQRPYRHPFFWSGFVLIGRRD